LERYQSNSATRIQKKQKGKEMKSVAIALGAVCAAVLPRLVVATDLPRMEIGKNATESAPVEFAGFRLGQTLDVENTTVRAEWGLGSPSRVVLANVKYEYLDCETVGPTNGWDSVGVSVSLPDKKVVSIDAVAKCKDKESAEQRRKVVVVDFKAKHPSRENEKGDKTFEASVSGTSVDACLSSESFRAVNRKNNELAAFRH
jgi:hypothetical protein